MPGIKGIAGGRFVVKRSWIVALLAAFAATGAAAPTAQASFGITLNGAAPTNTQAGAHSNVVIDMAFPDGGQDLQDLDIDMPAGLVGNPNATSKICTVTQLNADNCPAASQVGDVSSTADSPIGSVGVAGNAYLITPQNGEPARLGMVLKVTGIAALGIVTPIYVQSPITLRASDYGLTSSIRSLPRTAHSALLGDMAITIRTMKVTLYGTPPSSPNGPFLTNPTDCTPATFVIRGTAYSGQTATASKSFTPTGCASAPFTPTFDVSPKTQSANQPTPFNVTIGFPAPDAGTAQANLKSVAVTLPVGTALSAGVGSAGLQGCSDAQFGLGASGAPSCPALSQIGTVSFTTPLLGTLNGTVWLGAPTPSQKFRLFVYAALNATEVKLGGIVSPDAVTGQLTTTFSGLPEVPFTAFTLSFRGGDNAVLKAPSTCGTNTASAKLESYATPGTYTTLTSTFTTNNCPATAFAPTLATSFSTTQAGADTHMAMTIARGDDQPLLDGMNVSLPTGLLGRLASIPACPVASAATGSCGANTQVGTVTALAGTGNTPASLTGPIYLTDAVGDGVAGLAVVVPATVGPIDLGSVVVLTKLKVRADLGIDVTATSLPRIIGGVPLMIRSMKLDLNKDGFLLNASTCTAKTISASFTAQTGATASASAPYQATGCNSVAFAPTLDVSPKSQSADAPTAVSVTLGFPAGAQSNLKDVQVLLPAGTALSPGIGANGLAGCSDAQFGAGNLTAPTCPALSKIGTVSMNTPLLSGALTGDVYLGAPTPSEKFRLFVYASLGTVKVKLPGTVTPDAQTGQLTTTFSNLPEVPFTAFTLNFRGGDAAVLKAPSGCQTNTTTATLVPYARPGTSATPSSSFTTVDCAKAPFSPTLTSTVSPTQATADTHMTMTVARTDDQPLIDGMTVSMPRGMLAHIDTMPACSLAQAASASCPANTQVGTVTTQAGTGNAPASLGGKIYFTAGSGDAVGGLSIVVPATVGPIDLGNVIVGGQLEVRSDLGVDVVVDQLPRIIGGVPLALRSMKLVFDQDGFLFNASSCSAKQFAARFTDRGDNPATAYAPYQATGCSGLPFTPTLDVSPKQQRGDQPTPVTVTLGFPAGQTQANLQTAKVVLPVGTALSPGVGAHGLEACTDAQFDVAATTTPTCAAASKLGTVTMITPLLGQLDGAVYLGTPKADAPLRVFVYAAKSPVKVKLAGTVTPDPQTGQLTTTFTDLPEVPFTSFALNFRGGDDAVLKAPPSCGTNTATAELVPYGDASATARPRSTFATVDCSHSAFAPTLAVAVDPAQAAADTHMTMTIERADDSPLLDGMNVSLPGGLLGHLGDIPGCPVSDARAARCPQASRVGTVTARAGTGNAPATLTGPIYLTGSVDDGIAGLAVVVPAKVGPIDLGNVVVLTKLKLRGDVGIDVTATSLPRIAGGVPLTIRSMKLALDRDGFLLNASSCDARTIDATFAAQDGATASASAPYQATGCEGVAFGPQLRASIGGTPSAPSLTTTIDAAPGQATMSGVQLTLPVQLGADLAALAKVCQPEAYDAGQCPAVSTIGSATADSPLIPIPLSGPVRLVKVPGRALPSLAIDLSGVMDVHLRADNESAGGHLRSVVNGIPDVPLSSFTLTLASGGLLKSDQKMLCTGVPQVDATFTAHTGATSTASAVADTPCRTASGLSKVTLTGSLTHTKKGRQPSLRVRVRGSNLRSLRITMPKQLKLNRKRLKKGGRVYQGGRAVSRKTKKGKRALRPTRSTVTGWTTLKWTGSLEVRLAKGALRRGKGLKPGKKVTIKVRISDTTGRTRALVLRVKARK